MAIFILKRTLLLKLMSCKMLFTIFLWPRSVFLINFSVTYTYLIITIHFIPFCYYYVKGSAKMSYKGGQLSFIHSWKEHTSSFILIYFDISYTIVWCSVQKLWHFENHEPTSLETKRNKTKNKRNKWKLLIHMEE